MAITYLKMMPWYIYIVQCSKGALYTGIAIDVHKRIAQHNAGTGARSVRALGKPVKLMYVEKADNKSCALKREYAIKRMTRSEKFKLIENSTFKVNP